VDPLRGLKDRLDAALSLAHDRFCTETVDAEARMLSPRVRGANTRLICIGQAAQVPLSTREASESNQLR